MSLSVVVLTRNEERHIGACLASLADLGDERLVFDSYSDDATVKLAEAAGARVCQRRFDTYPAQRNAALESAQGEWVFFVDADERATAEVRDEIRSVTASGKEAALALYWIPRRNYIFGKWIRHTGWYPDYQPRLLRRTRAEFDLSRPVHELVLVKGTEAYLTQPLIHYNYETVRQFIEKQGRYTRFEAQMGYAQGIRPRLRGNVGQPLREFVRRFISLQGYRDGLHGLVLSTLMAYYAFQRQRILAELWRANGHLSNRKK